MPAVQTQTKTFQTEVNQLLHLMVHSLYSNKEIFLRELISNASDACDKLSFAALEHTELFEGNGDLSIEITFQAKKRTITVKDNGIGMRLDEVEANLGTIARSGTAEFMQQLTGDQKKDSGLIGQFGVGFYSAFIVADKIEVFTRRAGEPSAQGVYWVSAGDGQYDIGTTELAARGTEIILHLKKAESEFLDEWRLRNLVSKYSDHISRPVMMRVRDYAAESELRGDDADKKVADQFKLEQINAATALWTRNKSELQDSDYQEFYKHIAHDYTDPLTWSHNRVEGKLNYTSLLFIPAKAPFDLWNREAQRGLKLYVQRVFIMDDAEQFLPLYLRFMKGVIDSNDLSLNVSREILQNNKTVRSLRTALTKRALSLLEKMAAKKPEQYQLFWDQFGQVLKEGPAEDRDHQEKISHLLRFATTHGSEKVQNVSLSVIQERMKEGQKALYYLAAETHEAALASPHLEIFRKQGIEVMLLSDRVDEWLMSHLSEFNGLPFKDIAKGELDLDEILGEPAEPEQKDHPLAQVIEHFSALLGEDISEVRFSRRLTDSPACLVVNEGDMGAQMQRLLLAAGQSIPSSKPVLELNSEHPLMLQLNVQEIDDEQTDLMHVIYEQARLAGGDGLKDPSSYVSRLNRLLLRVH